MGKKEEMEKARAIAEIEAKFAEPEYKGEKVFSLIGIICAGITVGLACIQLWDMVKTVQGPKYYDGNGNVVQAKSTFVDRIKMSDSNPMSVIAPFFWCISCIIAGGVALMGELKFEKLLERFEMIRRPIGKGIYCIFLGSFYVNDYPGSYLWITNIVIVVLGVCYICIGLCCKKKNEIEVAPTTTK